MRRVALLLVPAIVITAIALLLPAIPQPLAYHNFADHRVWLGIPNFGDVMSNIPFAIRHTLKHLAAAAAGYWILQMLKKKKTAETLKNFVVFSCVSL